MPTAKKASSKKNRSTPKKLTAMKSSVKTVARTASVKAQPTKKLTTTKAMPMKKVTKTTSLPTVAQKIKTVTPFKPVFNKQTIVLLIAVILIGLAFIFRGQYLAAIVNGQPIWRFKVMSEAERMQGPQILENAVMEALIQQKAQKQGVMIASEAVDAQIEEIKQNLTEQGQDFDQLMALQGLTMKELQRQIKLQQMVEALVGSSIEISQEEIDNFIEQNKEFLPEESSDEELQELARQQLQQQQMSVKYQQWITDLKEEAKIQYFVGYGPQNNNLDL